MENVAKKFSKGEVIFVEGALESFMYDLVRGTVAVYADYGKPSETLLTELKAEDGATLGELGLIDVMPRSATAIALDDVEAYLITGDDFGEYFKENPSAVILIMQNMSRRIRELTQDYMDACHAVAEIVESEKTGKEKSSWFKKAVVRFIDDFKMGYELGLQCNVHRMHF